MRPRRIRPVDAVRQTRWQRQRARPPRCPRGWSIGPPDFVGVGAHKSGTAWWYHLIVRHPEVTARGHPKELHYFDSLGDRYTPEDAARYHQWFPRPPGRHTGEWTPNYATEAAIAPRLASAAPETRLLMLVRDPVDRYQSDLTMLWPGTPELRSFAEARGRYGTQVANVCRAFDRDRLLILQYERCVAEPQAELARTYRFLGLDDSFRPALASRRINETTGRWIPIDDDERRGLVERLAPEVLALAEAMPDLDLSRWPSMSHLR